MAMNGAMVIGVMPHNSTRELQRHYEKAEQLAGRDLETMAMHYVPSVLASHSARRQKKKNQKRTPRDSVSEPDRGAFS